MKSIVEKYEAWAEAELQSANDEATGSPECRVDLQMAVYHHARAQVFATLALVTATERQTETIINYEELKIQRGL